jgi:hypothetical protein
MQEFTQKKTTVADNFNNTFNCGPYPMQRPAQIYEKMKGTSKKLKIASENLRDTHVKQNAL